MPGSHNEALPDTAHLESLANIRGQQDKGRRGLMFSTLSHLHLSPQTSISVACKKKETEALKS